MSVFDGINDMVKNEAIHFCVSVCVGVGLAVIYDIIRIIRRIIRHNIVVISIEDMLFWTIAGIVSFLICFFLDDGNVRWYSIFGEIVGAIIYKKIIEKD